MLVVFFLATGTLGHIFFIFLPFSISLHSGTMADGRRKGTLGFSSAGAGAAGATAAGRSKKRINHRLLQGVIRNVGSHNKVMCRRKCFCTGSLCLDLPIAFARSTR